MKQPLTADEHHAIANVLYAVYSQTINLVGSLRLPKTHRVIVRLRRAADRLSSARSALDDVFHHDHPSAFDARVYYPGDVVPVEALDQLADDLTGVLRLLYLALPVNSRPVKCIERSRQLLKWARVPLLDLPPGPHLGDPT